jgi:hypothetical protein
MREVDPDIVLIGPEVSQWNGTPQVDPVDPEGVDWLRGFLRANADIVDVVAVHRYPFPRSQANPVTTIEEMRGNTPEWGQTLENLRQVILEETGRDDLPVAITEVGSHWSSAQYGVASPDSHYNAIWWADSLGRLLQDNPFIIAYFNFQSLPAWAGGVCLPKTRFARRTMCISCISGLAMKWLQRIPALNICRYSGRCATMGR